MTAAGEGEANECGKETGKTLDTAVYPFDYDGSDVVHRLLHGESEYG